MEPSPDSPQTPKESVLRRYKLVWRALLIGNLGLGAYMFVSRKKNLGTDNTKGTKPREEEVKPPPESPTSPAETMAVPEEPEILSVVTPRPAKVREPIPEDQQRELFKWMLEEKRKIKPKDREEKKRIDEDKAILKQFIRAEKIPKFLTDDSIRS